MTNSISVKSQIEAPAEKVFAKAIDFAAMPDFLSTIKSVEVLTPGPVGKGTRFRETRVMFGTDATEEMEITEFDPPRRLVMEAEGHGCRYRSELHFRGSGAATDLEMIFSAEPLSVFAKVMSVVLRPVMRMMTKSMAKMVAKDLEDLKAEVERGN